MTNKNITALPAATIPLAGTELLLVWDGTGTKKTTINDVNKGRPLDLTTTVDNGNNSDYSQVLIKFGNPTYPCFIKAYRYGGSYINGLDFYYSDAGSGSSVKGLRLGPTGDVTAPVGNWIPGTAGKGINFTANTPAAGMTSQLLNWYEEGAWTPALFDSAGHAFTVGTALGRYIRIGKSVTLQCRFTWSSIGSADASPLILKGLPWPVANITNFAQSATIGYMDGLDTVAGTKQITSSVISPAISWAHFHQINDNSAQTYVPANSCSATGELRWSITYLTD